MHTSRSLRATVGVPESRLAAVRRVLQRAPKPWTPRVAGPPPAQGGLGPCTAQPQLNPSSSVPSTRTWPLCTGWPRKENSPPRRTSASNCMPACARPTWRPACACLPRGRCHPTFTREAGHTDLEARLIESQYEVTDRLAYHLSGRNPEHHLGQHFILPEMADCLDLSVHARAAKHKLQALPEVLFVELARDLYDEVDRRECETLWLGGGATLVGADRQAVPFLPVSPELSSTRNQARQKLARLTAREFATLLIDVLSEAKRRHLGAKQPGSEERRLSDDEPLYDSVASDEDNHMGRQLWQRLSDLQQEQAALRLDVETLRAALAATDSSQQHSPLATYHQPLQQQRGSSSPQAQRSPRPQSMCEWRHLAKASATAKTSIYDFPSRHVTTGHPHRDQDGEGIFSSQQQQPGLPTYQEVLAQTERITRCIQELLACAQEGKQAAFLPCTHGILQAVLCMSSLFGGQPAGGSSTLGVALSRLVASARQLQRWASGGLEGGQLIQGAYEVAKGAKELVQAYPATPPPV
ncbi:ARF GTPase-activating protein GIT1 isoform X3 [Amblyomma americanum]